MMDDIESTKGQEMSFGEGIAKVEQGETIASGRWRIQKNEKQIILVAEVNDNGEYVWLDSPYYPPILLDLSWHITEKMKL